MKYLDLTGQKFGMLTALSRIKNSIWRCQCNCGNIVYMRAHALKYSNSKTLNCGCYVAQTKFHDLTGKRFGLLTVIKRAQNSRSNKVMWFCRCDCGTNYVAVGARLLQGYDISCGCVLSDKRRLMQIWADMVGRCTNESYKSWKYYGGKGIKVCDTWKDYSNFKQWALSNGYGHTLTLDRIDSNKDYYPENCRWITLRENQERGLQTALHNRVTEGRILSNDAIDYIRAHRNVPAKELAKQFNRCENTIRNVWNGVTKKQEWKVCVS